MTVFILVSLRLFSYLVIWQGFIQALTVLRLPKVKTQS